MDKEYIHFFGIDVNGGYSKDAALKVARNYDHIIIDEFSMLSAAVYGVLYVIKLNPT